MHIPPYISRSNYNCIIRYIFFMKSISMQYNSFWNALSYTKCSRGCQVIATNFLTFFSFDFSHKTVVFGRRTLYCCHKISGEDVMSLSQNFILGSLQHIPYQRSLSYYHFLLFFLSIFHKKYPGFSRTSPNSFVESFIAEIVAATDPSNDNPPVA